MKIDGKTSLLIHTLAAYEAPWMPIRQHWTSAPAIHARRRGDAHCGGDNRQANRMRVSRLRAELREDGSLDTDQKLTAEGKRLARSYTWSFMRDQLTAALDALAAALAAGHHMPNLANTANLVPEQFIAGTDDPRDLGMLQEMLLPLLADGVLGSASHPRGRVFYFVADELADLKAIADSIIDYGLWSEAASDIYAKEQKRCRQVMLADNSYWAELGEIPVAYRPLISKRDYNDLSGIDRLFPPEDETNG